MPSLQENSERIGRSANGHHKELIRERGALKQQQGAEEQQWHDSCGGWRHACPCIVTSVNTAEYVKRFASACSILLSQMNATMTYIALVSYKPLSDLNFAKITINMAVALLCWK